MIECKIEEPAQDITSEMVRSAYNVLRKNCERHKDCSGCEIQVAGDCPAFSADPLEDWPDLDGGV